ncbi:MAG: hypothetical protein ACRD04_01485 [Terriglobales bacterium]
MKISARSWFIALALTVAFPLAAAASPLQLIQNGSFASGDLTGWTVTDANNGCGACGSWSVVAGTTATAALSNKPLPGTDPSGANYYALADEYLPASNALTQSFTVPDGATRLDLSFNMFINNWGAVTNCGDTLTTLVPNDPNQCVFVSILAGAAKALTESFVAPGVVDSIVQGAPFANSETGSHGWVGYNYELTNLTPGDTYQLQFAQANDQGNLNVGVTDVSLTAVTVTPEPVPLLLLATGLLGLALVGRKFWPARTGEDRSLP